jgi:hypothetical protein
MEPVGADPDARRRRRILFAAAIALHVIATLIARRRGYKLGGNVIVRCRQGHLFTTIWVPGASLKALRIGWVRFQWCPVGRHWTFVVPVREASLGRRQRRRAAAQHDVRVP